MTLRSDRRGGTAPRVRTPSRRSAHFSFGRPGCIGATLLLLASARPAAAQWDLRLGANYEEARYAGVSYRTSTQELTARDRLTLGDQATLSITGRLQHEIDFRASDDLYRGYGDAQFRSLPVDLFLRIRPDQRQAVSLPPGWRLKETSWGGSLRPGFGPVVTYTEGKFERIQSSPGPVQGQTRNRRLGATWSVLGTNLDYTFTRAQNSRKVEDLTAGAAPQSLNEDHGGGIAVDRDLGVVHVNAGYHRGDTKWKRGVVIADTTGTESRYSTTRIVGNRAQAQVTAQPRPSLLCTAGADWAETQNRGGGLPPRLDRTVDVLVGANYRPWRPVGIDVQRTFQQQHSPGFVSRSDLLRFRVQAAGPINEDLRLTGDVSHSVVLASRDAGGAADQLNLGITGRIRTGADMSLSASGSRLLGVPPEMRYQVTETAELRLSPVPAFRCNLSLQGFGLGRSPDPSSPDRIQYRAELQATSSRGGSASLAYTSRTIRHGSTGEKYALSGSAGVPWKGSAFSWTGSFSRADDLAAAAGRAWGYASTFSARLRVSRQADISLSQSRGLPAVGAGNSTWIASVQQSIR